MKNLYYLFILILIWCNSANHSHENHQNSNSLSTGSLSPHTQAMAMINGAHIHIDYSSPSVRNRIIFGGLLAFDEVWQSGAHNATWIETDYDLLIEGKKLEKGKYGFFTIPSKEEWTVIFNSNWEQHGKDEYDDKDDVLRFSVNPEELEESVESLKYEVKEKGENEGLISLSWEKTRILFHFKVQ